MWKIGLMVCALWVSTSVLADEVTGEHISKAFLQMMERDPNLMLPKEGAVKKNNKLKLYASAHAGVMPKKILLSADKVLQDHHKIVAKPGIKQSGKIAANERRLHALLSGKHVQTLQANTKEALQLKNMDMEQNWQKIVMEMSLLQDQMYNFQHFLKPIMETTTLAAAGVENEMMFKKQLRRWSYNHPWVADEVVIALALLILLFTIMHVRRSKAIVLYSYSADDSLHDTVENDLQQQYGMHETAPAVEQEDTQVQENKDPEPSEYDFMGSAEGVDSKIDLIRSYFSMGQEDDAIMLLQEILQIGDSNQRQIAQQMLQEHEEKNKT
jgi:FimV-like protein